MSAPPRFLELLLARILDARDRPWILGDLREEYARLAMRDARAADRWYRRQVLHSIVPSLRQRVRRPAPRGRGASRELLYATRSLGRRPGPALLALVALALATGANIATFAVVDGVVWQSLPYPNAERIVVPHEVNEERLSQAGWASVPNGLDWRDRARTLDRVALYRGRSMAVTGGDAALYVYGAFASDAFFDVFGAQPLVGRTFVPADMHGEPVAVIAHGLWQRRFGGDRGAIGGSMLLDGTARTIIGVMPEGFGPPGEWIGPRVQMDVWIPFPMAEKYARGDRSYNVVARLAPGATVDDARAELADIGAALRAEHPAANEDWTVNVATWKDLIVGDVRSPMLQLFLAMTLVLVVAVANAANLLLRRALVRSDELRIRKALGASPGRVAWGAGAESLLLTGVGVVAGVAVAAGLVGMLVRLNPGNLPRMQAVSLDSRSFAFAGLLWVGMAGTLVAAQAWLALRTPMSAPSSTARVVGPGGAGRAARDVLALAQLSLAFALLVGSMVVARGFLELRAVDPGFDPEDVLALTVALSWNRVTTIEERAAFTSALLARYAALPGVSDVAMINSLPLSGSNASSTFTLPGRPEAGSANAAMRGVSPAYARTLRIPVRGREFLPADLSESARTALVNEAFVRRYLPDRAPLGERISVQDGELVVEIVGVVGDVRHYGLAEGARPEIYLPYTREFLTSKTYLLRTRGAPLALAPMAREALRELDPDQPIRDLEPLPSVIDRSLAVSRFQAALLVALAGLAVILAAIGLVAVMTSLVAERRRDIAIRLAVGARQRQIVRWVLGRTVRIALPAATAGLLLSRWAGAALAARVEGVDPDTLPVVALALGAFATITVVGALAPAWSAARTDPARVLRDPT